MTGETQLQQIERPPSLSDIATEKLRAAISEGEFALGEALSEKKLAERLNISKTPIRHALAQMRVEGWSRSSLRKAPLSSPSAAQISNAFPNTACYWKPRPCACLLRAIAKS